MKIALRVSSTTLVSVYHFPVVSEEMSWAQWTLPLDYPDLASSPFVPHHLPLPRQFERGIEL